MTEHRTPATVNPDGHGAQMLVRQQNCDDRFYKRNSGNE